MTHEERTRTGKLWGGRFADGPSPELEALSKSTDKSTLQTLFRQNNISFSATA